MINHNWLKKILSIILVFSILLGIVSDIVPQKTYASDFDAADQSTIQRIVDLFGTSEVFIQQYLDQGYTLKQIITAFYKAQEDHTSFEEALKNLFPSEDNQSNSVTSEVYSDLSSPLLNLVNVVESSKSSIVQNYNFFPVTEAVYDQPSSVTDDVYADDMSVKMMALSEPEQPHIIEKAPNVSKSSFNEAPYSVGDNGESISSVSGSLTLKQTDAMLPGRNGMSFSLTRQYDSSASQFYDMDYGYNTYTYSLYKYFVQFNAVKKEILTRYNVKYRENKWVQMDEDGDGIVDMETAIISSTVKNLGVYNAQEEANEAASHRFQYEIPAQSITADAARYSSDPSSFPSYIYYNSDGFSGSLYPSGTPFVISGQYTPERTITATTQYCTSSVPGKYDSQGYWVQTGQASTCPETKTSVVEGYTITLTRTVEVQKSCPSPNPSSANYVCTKSWLATYNGSKVIPPTDTRNYQQNYRGTVTKPASVSDTKYEPWVTLSDGARQRYAYNVTELPWVEPEHYEGPGTNTTISTDATENWTDVYNLQNLINSNPNKFVDYSYEGDKVYSIYTSSSPNATIQSFQYGTGTDRTYYNKTTQPIEELMYPLGKGWSWQLPYIETKENKKYMHLAEGGSYEISGTSLKGYDWEGPTFNSDTSVTVNGETSDSVLVSADGTKKQYFTADGRILQISDAYNNSIQFSYEQNEAYGRKLLSQVKDAIGNTINITYSSTKVTVTQGDKTVVYDKHTQDGVELLDSVTDELGRKTTFSYKLAAAKFNLMASYPERAISNPYALITSVVHPTGAKTLYEYDETPVSRYIGADSVDQAYRILSRKDQIIYENGTTEDYNRQTLSYTSDMGMSYGQDFTFSTVLNNGLTSTTLEYRKDYIDDNTPAQFYVDRSLVKADGKEQTTAYSYAKKVGSRAYFAPAATATSTSDNLSGNTLTTSTQYDDYGNVTQTTDERGRTTINTYDSEKHWLLSTVTDVASNAKEYSQFTRTPQGEVAQVVVKKDNADGPILKQIDYTFDSYGNPVTQTIANGSKSITTTTDYSSTYNYAFPTGQSVTVTDVDGQTNVISTLAEYDSTMGHMTAFVDGNHHRTDYQYDALGRTVKVAYPDGNSLSAAYDDQQNTVTITDELGVQSLTRWNALGVQTEQGFYKNGDYEVTQRIGYDPYSRQSWSEDALGNRTRYSYDSWSRLASTTFADGSASNVSYDDALRTVTQTDAEGYAKIESYDPWGQLLKTEEKTQLDSIPKLLQQNVYDNVSGLVVKQIDGNQNTTQFAYDSLGQLITVTDANGDQTRYEYDMLGNLTRTIDPAGNVKETRYDELGNKILTIDKAGQQAKSYYDPNGNLTKLIDRNGNSFSYRYDLRDRLIQRDSIDGSVNYTYDAAGKRLSMTDNTGTTSYQYDPYTGNLVQTTYPDGLQLTAQYDKAGNRTEMTGPFGNHVYYSYDPLHRLKTVGTSTSQADAEYSYYLNGLQKGTISNNGVVTTNSYDGANLTDIQQVRDQIGLANYQYHYDPNRNITTRVQNNAADTFTYDKVNRIATSSPGNETYTYDKQGNRQVLSSDRMPDIKEITNTFDSRDHLTDVTINGTTVHYRYNGDGVLTERTDSNGTSRYYYDGDQIIAEAKIVNGQPELKANYIRGKKLEAIEYADGSKAYVQTNGHGDITELRDASGNILNTYQYDIWGNILSKDEQVYNPFRYSGELWDDTTGLQYLRARWYDPSIGRFISEDTYEGEINNPQTLNLYAYVENSPLVYTDPTGHMAVDELNGIAALYSSGILTSGEASAAIITANKKGFYTAFHEIAQVNIYKQLVKKGYSPILEKSIQSNEKNIFGKYKTVEADVVAGIYLWEVKPRGGASAKKQIEKYTALSDYVPGPVTLLNTMTDIQVVGNIYMEVEFPSNGEARYSFYRKEVDSRGVVHISEVKTKEVYHKLYLDYEKKHLFDLPLIPIPGLAPIPIPIPAV
ncbi:RHS repeat-associated core domain-containing protein [Paenibacillus caui]|uniref:RHS repeat-associated core domain-containing protein n=1 Tax=Paenibacillus caui TaxID=2873927 RepID=UPI001CA820C5|nr:RHS repeat-associated core domain-containing protein [Paenibacillus caui]